MSHDIVSNPTALHGAALAAEGWRHDPPFALVDYKADILAEEHGFGGFLFDLQGQPVLSDGCGWLYTTSCEDGLWHSWVRRFDLLDHSWDTPLRVLSPAPGSDRAVLHHVLQLDDALTVGFLCDAQGIAFATAPGPSAAFAIRPGFEMRPEPGWETREGPVTGWSLEVNGAHVLLENGPEATLLWLGYDSYRREGRLGDLGWAQVRIDKRSGQAALLGRHPGNPLDFRAPGWACARCGGNLAAGQMADGRFAFFFYVRPSEAECFIALALSPDPLFLRDVERFIVGSVIGEEVVAEKFEAVFMAGDLHLFYESKHHDGSWHTGFRRYRSLG
jgi:hypothetical protein